MTNEDIIIQIKAEPDNIELYELLYTQNRGLIAKIAKGYSHREPMDDLMQQGYFAMLKAIDHYEPDKGMKFSSYFVRWVFNEFSRYCTRNSNGIKYGIGRTEEIEKYQRHVAAFYIRHGREPSKYEMARIMSMTFDDLQRLQVDMLTYNNAVSLDMPLSDDDSITLSDTIADTFSQMDDVIDRIYQEELRAVIWAVVDTLSDEKRAVINSIYRDGLQLQNVADRMGITYSRVKGLKEAALYDLQHGKRIGQIKRVIEFADYDKAYRRSGVTCFKTTWTSSTEYLAIRHTERV